MPRLFVVFAMVAAVLVAPARAGAQDQPVPLSGLLPELYRDVINAEFVTLIRVFPTLIDVVQLAERRQRRLDLVFHVVDLAGNQLSSFPLGSGSGGFTWTFDTASGAFTRASNSFGPIFAERPLTLGRRRLNVGANYQRVTFDDLEGRSLRDGEIAGYLGLNIGDFGIFYADYLDLKVTTDTLNAFATYGLTDRLDIGVAVPINRVRMAATLSTYVADTVTGVDETPTLVTSRSGSASGVGDIVIRAKFNMLNGKAGAIGQAIDIRLPTGDEHELLGTAGHQIKLNFIAALAAGRLSPHLNVGYTISGTSPSADDQDSYVIGPPEEVNYAGGADLALSLRTTVAFDVVGRVLREAGRGTWGPSEFGAEFPQFQLHPNQDLHLLLGSVGLKVNPFANMLVTANVLFPLAKRGLTDSLTWMAGFDYSF